MHVSADGGDGDLSAMTNWRNSSLSCFLFVLLLFVPFLCGLGKTRNVTIRVLVPDVTPVGAT
ncbi:MAG TPA: hypothetical protein VMH23_05070, partial [Bacteroidota bacterium]|nr:hypothetical protein [Bacteroidota bacterium]